MQRSTSKLLLGIWLAPIAAGCFFGPVPIPPPAIPLDPAEQRRVIACQERIGQEVRQLHQVASRQFSRCAHLALDLVLDEERDLDSTTLADFAARRIRLVERCEAFFAPIGRASKRMIDGVIAKCEPVEDLILGDPLRGDPLGLKVFASGEGLSTAAELAGSYCGVATGGAEVMASLSFLRTADVALRYAGAVEEDDLRDFWQASLDPRCVPADLGL